jgi:hypothetical protein
MLGFFITSFFTHHEILWAVTLLLSGTLMFTSYNIEYYVYEFNSTTNAYVPVIVSHSYPYLMGINLVFFVLALIMCIFDLFDRYSSAITKKNNDDNDEK